jgi:adenine-specific DNA-methyltransferase
MERLNYIGSKFQLLDWITDTIKEKTQWETFSNKFIADLFAGTGAVTWHFRSLGATTISNDAERYSATITHAMAKSAYTKKLKNIFKTIDETPGVTGFVTRNFSPHEGCERMFFTVENAQKIDGIRARIHGLKTSLTKDEYAFLVASLLVAADAISNVPAVYGMYLKKFKKSAERKLKMKPIHTDETGHPRAKVTCKDVLSDKWKADAAYLDPPYNERQYSKNYFPLNIIAMEPAEAEAQSLHGKTGIPDGSFVSPFCQKKKVKDAFDMLFGNLDVNWIFMSYNSESILTKEEVTEIMGKYGQVSVTEKPHKRFKSFEYNSDEPQVMEYLFSLHKS